MKIIEREKSANTPYVCFNAETGYCKIEGRSIPEDPGDFYDELVDWLKEYFDSPATKTTLEINLEYINSGSSKFLLGLFRIFKDAYKRGVNLEICWYFEEDDEAIEGLGEHYRSITGVPFKLVEYI